MSFTALNVTSRVEICEFPVSKMLNTVFLVKSKKLDEYVLYDIGQNDEKTKRILYSYLNGRKVKYLIISHAHWDHCGNVKDFVLNGLKEESKSKKTKEEEEEEGEEEEEVEKERPKVIVHEIENEFMKKGSQSDFVGKNTLSRLFAWLMTIFTDGSFDGHSGDILYPSDVSEDLTKELKDDFGIEMLHTPGHAKGGLSLRIEDDGKLIFLCNDLAFPAFVGNPRVLKLPFVMQESFSKSIPILKNTYHQLLNPWMQKKKEEEEGEEDEEEEGGNYVKEDNVMFFFSHYPHLKLDKTDKTKKRKLVDPVSVEEMRKFLKVNKLL